MWDVGDKTFVVDQAVGRRNLSATERVNSPSLLPPIPPVPRAPAPTKKKRGILGKTIVTAVLLTVPNPMRESTAPEVPVTLTHAVPATTPIPQLQVPVSLNEKPAPIHVSIPTWEDLMAMVPNKPEVKPQATTPKVVGTPITVREIYITPPLISRPIFDIVGD